MRTTHDQDAHDHLGREIYAIRRPLPAPSL